MSTAFTSLCFSLPFRSQYLRWSDLNPIHFQFGPIPTQDFWITLSLKATRIQPMSLEKDSQQIQRPDSEGGVPCSIQESISIKCYYLADVEQQCLRQLMDIEGYFLIPKFK